jgi:hypothetical protein
MRMSHLRCAPSQAHSFRCAGPLVAAGVISASSQLLYIAAGTSVLCLRSTTGDKVWETKTWDYVQSTGLLMPNDLLLIGSNDYNIYALRPTTGEIAWQYKTSSGVQARPAWAFNTVYLASEDANVYAIMDYVHRAPPSIGVVVVCITFAVLLVAVAVFVVRWQSITQTRSLRPVRRALVHPYCCVPKFWTHRTTSYCFCDRSVREKTWRSRKRVAQAT